MPFWRRPYYQRRWRYHRRRRPRRYFRTTFRRRRRYRVRHRRFRRKLKKIPILQWQPPTIKKLKITGLYQLFFCTNERVGNNNTLYLDTIAPFHLPSGGSFSLTQFTLENLFDQHVRLRNWWTKSNDVLPLVRYFGCTIYCYYQQNVDYIIAYDNNPPMKASRLTYNGTQPSVMQLMRHRKVISCKMYNRKRKPYKKIKIPPPSQLKNQWYFQSSIADIPLVNIIASACSLDRWYANSKAITTTIGFTTLNAKVFTNHDFKNNNTYGYKPKPTEWLYGLPNGNRNLSQIKIGQCIYLGNSHDYGYGTQIQQFIGTTPTTAKWNEYFSKKDHWGNPFMTDYLDYTRITVKTTSSPQEILAKITTGTSIDLNKTLTNIGTFILTNEPFLINCRYNPYNDKGTGNEVYFLPIDNKAVNDWEPMIDKPELIAKDLPLWALFWGLPDWHRRAGTITSIDTHGITVFKTTYIFPKTEKYYVPIGKYFLRGSSQYFPEPTSEDTQARTQADEENWHPKLSFQTDVINAFCICGPGTVKLPDNYSTEAHIKYQFHFKLGGAPPPMEIVTDPNKQPQWTIPNNLNETPSLQSPGTPFQYFLYNFDQRGEMLTKEAAKRIKKDFKTKDIISSITGSTGLNIPTEKASDSDSETSTEEEIQETLQQQLKQQHRDQLKLRHRINKLLTKLSMLE